MATASASSTTVAVATPTASRIAATASSTAVTVASDTINSTIDCRWMLYSAVGVKVSFRLQSC